MEPFVAAFIPLFVAIDAPGLIPLFLGVTERLDEKKRRRVSVEAIATAVVICVLFMFLGHALFKFLGISVNDFRIAGGILLLVLAVIDLLIPGKPAVVESEMVGVFPLAMPLIAGPAALTTTLVLAQKSGYWMTTLSLAVNFLILVFCLLSATTIARYLGMNTLRALSKLVMVLLAAIAVNFIRVGITDAIRAAHP